MTSKASGQSRRDFLRRALPRPALDELQKEVGEWGEKTFGEAQRNRKMLVGRLVDEVIELAGALKDGGPRAIELEAADCLILLLGFAHASGFSLSRATQDKMRINRRRKWQKVGDMFRHSGS